MKALGIVRRIDQLGRLVVPKEVRNANGWHEGTPMEMFVDGDNLVIRKYGASEEEMKVIESLKSAKSQIEDLDIKNVMDHAIAFIEGR